ncbi:hypothetical protein [aff. Roholtiella sp. LEGE 12411]|uniref:hypothetical protein n=1 Tax=aff. Roholtiella sp. LEGE 12411 TaxID=1828822 RepID=UPI00187EF5A2|nr:hypothetical protein [aff. Roholtiella sp. LEGE 12411]MBE9038509.1 hypothetical protein [aff. Roholtiella sp. LEGE 12411]
MVKKRLTDLLQEEAQKFTPPEGESAIEVTAEEVAEETSAQELEQTSSRRTNLTKADLETAVKELTETLEKNHKKEAELQQQVVDLQSKLSEQQTSTERLTKELHEAKKTALQLAEANSQLIEETNASKQAEKAKSQPIKETSALKTAEKAKPQPIEETSALKPVKENYNPLNYKKSHRSSEKLAQYQPDNQHQPDNQPNESADASNNEMWLLD